MKNREESFGICLFLIGKFEILISAALGNADIVESWVSCLTGRPPSIKNESLSIGLPEKIAGRVSGTS